MTRALVLRAPGINCDRETAQACRLVGFDTDLVHINALLKAPTSLLDYSFLVIPGGFSYGDDLGAGALLAKNLTLHLGSQLRQFIDEGRPVLGICNGFQVLVRAGLLPDSDDHSTPGAQSHAVTSQNPPLQHATLTENASALFECRWVTLSSQPSTCIFTRGIERTIELPVAHGEGQFVWPDDPAQLQAHGRVPLVYATNAGDTQNVAYPENPNGSLGNIAGICNTRGNVFGLMPHPERYVNRLQHPQRRALVNGQGDGLLLFKNAYEYTLQFAGTSSIDSSAIHHEQPSQQKKQLTHKHAKATAYAQSGVDISAGEQTVRLMQQAVRATHGPEILAGMGAFAGVFSAMGMKKMRQPALVASTDGVGTKTLLAAQAARFDTIGYDIVNHCVNDLLMQGGKPLFFMDYLAMGKLDPLQAATIVHSVAAACKELDCALLGGETAEMPDVYLPGIFDLAGTVVGVVEQEDVINGSTIRPGDIVLGLPSSGLHTNGYSLARRAFAPYTLNTIFPELQEPLIDALLRPHRCYLREIEVLRTYLSARGRFIKGMAHITGGGFEGNIARILPTGTRAVIDTASWNAPQLFQLLARLANITREEQYRALNMGVGMVIILSPKSALEARCALPELLTIGHIEEGEGVILRTI